MLWKKKLFRCSGESWWEVVWVLAKGHLLSYNAEIIFWESFSYILPIDLFENGKVMITEYMFIRQTSGHFDDLNASSIVRFDCNS